MKRVLVAVAVALVSSCATHEPAVPLTSPGLPDNAMLQRKNAGNLETNPKDSAMTTGPKLHNWNDLPKDAPRAGIERVAFRGDHAMVVMNWLHPGMQPGPHRHPFEQLVLIVQGRTRLHVGDEVFDCGPGSMVRVPPDVIHYAEAIGDEVCLNLDVFAPVRSDYLHLVDYQKGRDG